MRALQKTVKNKLLHKRSQHQDNSVPQLLKIRKLVNPGHRKQLPRMGRRCQTRQPRKGRASSRGNPSHGLRLLFQVQQLVKNAMRVLLVQGVHLKPEIIGVGRVLDVPGQKLYPLIYIFFIVMTRNIQNQLLDEKTSIIESFLK